MNKKAGAAQVINKGNNRVMYSVQNIKIRKSDWMGSPSGVKIAIMLLKALLNLFWIPS